MIPQVGIELFKELRIDGGRLLDPYCGSGSSFVVGLDRQLKEMYGFDINPLAVLISRAKFTKVELGRLEEEKQKLRNVVYELVKSEASLQKIELPNFYNIDFWFSRPVLLKLAVLKKFINQIENRDIKRFFWMPFSETLRECSYTRSYEFKLYRKKPVEMANFNPDVFGIFFEKLNRAISIYGQHYLPKLDGVKITVDYQKFDKKEEYYDVVLTSPPYGDSKTTVAYGQFSIFANEWMGIKNARQIDGLLMGGKKTNHLYEGGIMSKYVNLIAQESRKRALEVSSFYIDLENSIKDVAESIKPTGISVYVVGNRTVKKINLPTDQFIAEKFEENGFRHLFTYERKLGNKSMPLENSPSNKVGQRVSTMTYEYVVVCQKKGK
jgi:hypothetical protein